MKLISTLFQILKPDRYSLGIEITETSVKLTELEKGKGRFPSISKYLVEPLPLLTIDDGRIMDPMKVIVTIQSMLAKINVRAKNVHLVIPSQLVMVRFLKFPDIPLKDLKKLVDFEIKHNMHLPFDQPYYDFCKLNGNENNAKLNHKLTNKRSRKATKGNIPLGNHPFEEAAASSENVGSTPLFGITDDESKTDIALQCDVMLVAAPQDLVEQYTEVMIAAGLVPKSVEIKALSMYRVIKITRLIEPKSTFLLVDINDHASDLSIFNQSQLKITRNVPLKFSITKDESAKNTEQSPLFYEFSEHDVDFTNACNDLVHELERLMNFYRYTLNNRDQEFNCIVLSGDVSRLRDIAAILKDRIPLQINILYSDRIQATHTSNFENEFPALSVPIGLALRGNANC